MNGSVKRIFIIASALAAFLFAGCASTYMIKTAKIESGPDYAIVNFIRPTLFGGAIKFGVWDRDQVVGVLTPERCVQYRAAPGEHLFLIRAENWGIVKATVEAGKTYTILVEPRLGLFKANVHPIVIKPDDKRLAGWMKNVVYETLDPAIRDKYARGRDDDALRAARQVDEGKAQPDDVMSPADGE